MKQITKQLWGGLILSVVLMAGCATKQVASNTEQVPIEPMGVVPPVKAEAQAGHLSHYVVRSHDTLWAIAGKANIYGDSFQWPLIYKSNRDLIKDPDLIYPRQNFKIDKSVDTAEVSEARKLAMHTPKYVPHTQPRQTQLVEYF